jgi:type I restriction enzyme S subunit
VALAIRGSYERSAVVPDHLTGANVSRDVARIAPLDNLSSRYLHIYIQSEFARQYLRRHARGVAVKGVNIASVRALPVVVPPLYLQLQLVDEVESKVSAARQLLVEVHRTLVRVNRLRRLLLTETFAGRLVPQDPHDESATVLLEQIRAVRSAAPKTRRTRESGPRQETLL